MIDEGKAYTLISIKQAIIVEGRYDKIRLNSLIDGLILETNGFRIFKDREKLALIRIMARRRGIVILTDSDSAGFRIRGYIRSAIPAEDQGKIYQAYIPEILGKEKRKAQPSKAGTLGVEGMPSQILLNALSRAGIPLSDGEGEVRKQPPITKTDFFRDGLTGGADSGAKRRAVMSRLNLPPYLSANALLEILNASMTRREYEELIAQICSEQKEGTQ